MATSRATNHHEMVPLGYTTEQDLDAEPIEQHTKQAEAGIQNWQAFVNAFKSFVGVGILALPFAIRQSGLLSGVLCLIAIAFASSYTIKQVVRCKNELHAQGRVRFGFALVKMIIILLLLPPPLPALISRTLTALG